MTDKSVEDLIVEQAENILAATERLNKQTAPILVMERVMSVDEALAENVAAEEQYKKAINAIMEKINAGQTNK